MKRLLFFISLVFSAYSLSFAQQTQVGWTDVSTPNFCNNAWDDGGELHLISRDTVYVMNSAGCFYKTFDGGQNWQEYTTPATGLYDMDFLNANLGMAVGANGTIIKTADAATNWSVLNTGTTQKLRAIDIIDHNTAWVVGDTATVLHTNDAGITWQHLTINGNKNIYDIKFQNDQIGYMVGAGGFFLKTIDGGATWNAINLNTNEDFFALSVKGGHIRFLAGMRDFGSRSADSFFDSSDGLTWTPIAIFSQFGAGDIDFADSNIGYYAESACATCNCDFLTVKKTDNNGYSWNDSLLGGGGVSCSNANDIKVYDEQTAYVLSGLLIYSTTDGGTFTNLGIAKDSQQMLRLFPNPAKNQLNISANKDFNQVIIFDVLGNVVQKATNGSSMLTLDISGLPKGVYFVRVIGENYQSIRKLFVE